MRPVWQLGQLDQLIRAEIRFGSGKTGEEFGNSIRGKIPGKYKTYIQVRGELFLIQLDANFPNPSNLPAGLPLANGYTRN